MKFKIGDRVYVNIIKGGYWVNGRMGPVVGLTAKRVKVKTIDGTKNYSPRTLDKR